jgi:uncharacterized protein YbjT (DUF2867 family)
VVVAVTGATGFVGRHLVAVLVRRGHRVRALVRDPKRAAVLPAGDVAVVTGSLADPAALAALCRGAEGLVHLVGIVVETRRASFAAVHVEGTRRLLAAALAEGVARLVHMSATGARPEPAATPYHRTKWEAEELVRGSGLAAVIMRPSIINGPENVPIRTLIRVHHWLPVVPVFGHGGYPTQPIWIDDLALAFALALERGEIGGTLELGGPAVLSFDEFVRAIGRASGHPRPLVHLPMPLVRLLARLADPMGAAAPITSDQLRMLIEGTATPHNAITSAFGIAPLPFEEGLRRFLHETKQGPASS